MCLGTLPVKSPGTGLFSHKATSNLSHPLVYSHKKAMVQQSGLLPLSSTLYIVISVYLQTSTSKKRTFTRLGCLSAAILESCLSHLPTSAPQNQVPTIPMILSLTLTARVLAVRFLHLLIHPASQCHIKGTVLTFWYSKICSNGNQSPQY